jgi:hypothetical protein
MPQKGTEKRRSYENVVSRDKSALLWMYCREIAPFETPSELIARATSTPHRRATYRGRPISVRRGQTDKSRPRDGTASQPSAADIWTA